MFRLALCLSLAAVAACDPYAPSLDDVPFLCDRDDKLCPDGYEAVTVGAPNFCECRLPGFEPPATPDAGTPPVNNDCSADPANGTTAAPTATPIGTSTTTYFADTSVCSLTDVDYYRVVLGGGRMSVRARLSFTPSVGVLGLRIVNQNGAELAVGTADASGGIVIANYTATAGGNYLVEVKGASGYGPYSLTIEAL